MSGNIINAEILNAKISFEKIQAIYGKTKIIADFPAYITDESKLEGKADWLFFPKSEAEIVRILEFLQKNKIRASISAARTGIVGACVPNSGSVISTEKMNKIIGFGFDKKKNHFFLRVEPGITLNQIENVLIRKELESISELTPNAINDFKELKQQFHYPVDPTEMSATIGGTVATNASGARSLKYGPTREWIKGLRVLLSSSDILDIQRGDCFASEEGVFIVNKLNGKDLRIKIPNYDFNTTVKNVAGIFSKPNMDLIDLFIGCEGILGIITQIDIWIIEKHLLIYNVLFFTSEEEALSFGTLLQNNKILSPEFIEFFSPEALNLLKSVQNEEPNTLNIPQIPKEAKSAIFFDLPYSEDKLDEIFNEIKIIAEKCNTDLSKGWSGYEEQDYNRFRQFRHSLPEHINSIIAKRKLIFPQLHKLGTDMSVPREYIRKIIEYYHSVLNELNLEYVIFGHLGDNHVHVNIVPKNMEEFHLGEEVYEKFARKVVEFGGSISGEHGVGKIKKQYLKIMYSQEDLNEMRRIKKTLDPSLILNYGNIIDLEEEID